MSKETKTPEELENEPVLLKKDLAGIGIENVEELQAVLKQAVEMKKGGDVISRIANDFTSAMGEFTKAMQEMRQGITAGKEAESFDAMSADQIHKYFDGLQEGTPQHQELREKFEKLFGHRNVSLQLDSKSALTKALQRPITKEHPAYAEHMDIRDAWDKVYMLSAIHRGVLPGRVSEDVPEFDYRTLLSSVKRLKDTGRVPGIDEIEKYLTSKAVNTAYDTATATEGAEWIPTDMSANMIEDVQVLLRVASLFPRWNMPTRKYDVPTRPARGRSYRMSEATAASQFFTNLAISHGGKTGKITFEAEKLAALQMLSGEVEQDAILDTLRIMREEIIWALAEGIEDAAINGTTSLSDLDNAGTDTNRLWNNTADAGDGIRLNTGAADVRNAWDGIRKSTQSGARVDFGNATDDLLAKLRDLRKPMGKYASTVDRLVYLIALVTQIDLLNVRELLTLDKYGPNATILTGEVGKFDGIPVVQSALQKTFYNASGVYDHAVVDRTLVHCIYTGGFGFADRRAVRVESDRNPLADLRYVLATWRGDFQPLFANTENVVAEGYNLPTA